MGRKQWNRKGEESRARTFSRYARFRAWRSLFRRFKPFCHHQISLRIRHQRTIPPAIHVFHIRTNDHIGRPETKLRTPPLSGARRLPLADGWRGFGGSQIGFRTSILCTTIHVSFKLHIYSSVICKEGIVLTRGSQGNSNNCFIHHNLFTHYSTICHQQPSMLSPPRASPSPGSPR